MTPAPLTRRIGARVVDLVVWGWVLGLVVVEVQGRLLRGDLFGSSAVVDVSRTELLVAGLATIAALEVAPNALWGRTLGKALLGLRVVPVGEPDRTGIGWTAAVARALVIAAPFLVPTVGWLLPAGAALATVASQQRRGPHDRLAGTAVVHVAPAPASPVPSAPGTGRQGHAGHAVASGRSPRHRFPAAAMAPLPLDEVTVATLVEVGVPVEVTGAFRVDRRMAVFDEHLFRVGLDPAGRSLCVASPGGEVVAVDEAGVLAPRFAGTTLARFVAGLDALDARRAAGAREVLAELDPDALADPESWWNDLLAVP